MSEIIYDRYDEKTGRRVVITHSEKKGYCMQVHVSEELKRERINIANEYSRKNNLPLLTEEEEERFGIDSVDIYLEGIGNDGVAFFSPRCANDFSYVEALMMYLGEIEGLFPEDLSTIACMHSNAPIVLKRGPDNKFEYEPDLDKQEIASLKREYIKLQDRYI